MINQQQAIQIALNSRQQFDLPMDFVELNSERRIIQLVNPHLPVKDELPTAGPSIDVIAWIVTLGHDVFNAELAVEEKTGKVVRIRKSRGTALFEDGDKSCQT